MDSEDVKMSAGGSVRQKCLPGDLRGARGLGLGTAGDIPIGRAAPTVYRAAFLFQ